MVDLELGDLVDRLRDVAGGVTTVKQQAVQRVGEGTLLVLQQCLRRHPTISLLLTSQSERQRECLTMLRDAQEVEPHAGTAKEIPETLAWINAAASELEVERLSGVFEDGEKAHAWYREQEQRRLGVSDTPLFTQNRESYVCPWNVLFTLLSGPLCEASNNVLAKAELKIPNATTAMLGALHEVSVEWTNSIAWCNLLKELNAFPIGNVRAIWQCALFIFPTSATLVQQYIKREIEALESMQPLRQCHEEDEARAIFTAHLRLLNTFGRHLEMCYSCKLYELFFDYLFDFIEPDNPTHTDKLFRACLFRDVGFHPCSTPLWTRYLAWKSGHIRDERKRVEWRRSLFRRILQMPLLGTEKVKEEYDAFVSYELGGRMAPPEKIEMEKMYIRAKMEAVEINQILTVLSPEERLTQVVAGAASPPAYKSVNVTAPGAFGFFGVPPVLTPQLVAAYEPPLSIQDGVHEASSPSAPESLAHESVEARADHARRMVAASTRLWGLWESLVRMVRASSLGGAALRRDRVRVYLAMRACFFVRNESSWRELLDYVVDGKATSYTEKERLALAEDVLHLRSKLSMRGIFFPMYAANLFYHALERHGAAFRMLQRAALDERHWLLDFIRKVSQSPDISVEALRAREAAHGSNAASTHLQNLCVLGVNWMRMIAHQQDRFHTLLVSRYMMHQIDFLSLSMSALKLLLKNDVIQSPEDYLRPFNVYSAAWIKLEVVRNQNYEGAEQILCQWKEHLRMLLRSAKAKDWTTEMCGADESFHDSCICLMTADPTRVPAVLRCAGELAGVARADALRGNFLAQYEAIRHRFFDTPTPIEKLPQGVLSLCSGGVPPACRVPSTHYDTQLFTPVFSESLPVGWDGLTDEAVRTPHRLHFTGATKSVRALPGEVRPEESLWGPAPNSSSHSTSFGGRGAGYLGRGGISRYVPTPRFDHLTRPNSAEGESGAGVAQRTTSRRTIVCHSLAVSRQAFPLLPARGSRTGRGQGSTSDGLVPQRARQVSTDAIATLLTHLPTRYQYIPVEGDISTEWLLRFLSTTEGLKWTEGMVRPSTPSADEAHDEEEEEEGEEGQEGEEDDDEERDEELDEALYAALLEEMGELGPGYDEECEALEEYEGQGKPQEQEVQEDQENVEGDADTPQISDSLNASTQAERAPSPPTP